MPARSIFLSVGATANEGQEAFIRAVEDRLRSEGLFPQTVGRNTFSSDAPLKKITELLDSSHGAVVIALERSFFPLGFDKRGSPSERQLHNIKLPTPWNQIEAAMAYSRRLPLMVLIEKDLKSEGLLEAGYDWYVQRIEPVPSALTTIEFNSVLSDWKSKVERHQLASVNANSSVSPISPAEMTVHELLGRLRPAQLWSTFAAIAAITAGAFALGAKFVN